MFNIRDEYSLIENGSERCQWKTLNGQQEGIWKESSNLCIIQRNNKGIARSALKLGNGLCRKGHHRNRDQTERWLGWYRGKGNDRKLET